MRYILIVVLLTAIVGGGILAYQFLLAPKEESKISEVKLSEVETQEEIPLERVPTEKLSSLVLFDEFSQIVNSRSDLIISEPPSIDRTSSFYWKSDNGWYINIGGKMILRDLYIQRLSIPVPITHLNMQEKIIENPTMKKLYELMSELFFKNGLVVNSNNSLTLLDSGYQVYFFAFQGNGLRCQTGTGYSGANSLDSKHNEVIRWSILCVTDEQFQEAYQEQFPFLRGISSGKEVTVIPGMVIENSVFLNLSFPFQVTGFFPEPEKSRPYNVIMKRRENLWEEIFRGTIPSCDLMQQYSIPKKVYQNCF